MMQLLQAIVDLPFGCSVLLKATALLAGGWALHLALLRANPRWRVLVWRGVLIGLAALPAISCLMDFRIEVAPPLPSPAPAVYIPMEGASGPVVSNTRIAPQSTWKLEQEASPSFSPADYARENWARIAMLIWGLGVALLSIRLMVVYLRMRRFFAAAQSAPQARLEILNRIARDLGHDRPIALKLTREISSPLLSGILRPTIYLPERIAATSDPTELAAILAHEVAHLRARDLFWLAAARWWSIALWPHPLAWKLQSAHTAACEEVSDAVAAGYLKDAAAYVRTLARVALAVANQPIAAVGIPMARSSQIAWRLHILKTKFHSSPLARRRVAAAIAIGAMLLVGFGGVRFVYAQPGTNVKNSIPESGRSTDPPKTGERVLHFPTDRAMGKVWVRDAAIKHRVDKFYYWFDNSEWDYLAEAQGDIAVPLGKSVKLSLWDEYVQDLTPLKSLGPNDIHTIHCGRFTDANLPCIAHLTGLKELDFRDYAHAYAQRPSGPPAITPRGLASLKALTGVQYVCAPDLMTDEALAQIARIGSIKGLYFGRNTVTDAGLKSLAELPHLEELSLTGDRITNDGLSNLSACARLEFLMISFKSFSTQGTKYLKDIPSLKILNIGHQRISDAGLKEIAKIKNLERLALYHNEWISNDGLCALQSLTNLKMLTLSWARQINDEGIANLRPLKSLEYLDINTVSNPNTTDKSIEYVSELPNLKFLTLNGSSNAPMSDTGVQYLARLQNLEELHISGTGITDKGIAVIAGLPRIKNLYLGTAVPKVTNAGVAELRNAKSLTHFEIGESATSIDCLNALNSLTNLTRVDFGNYRARPAAQPLNISGLVNLKDLTLAYAHDEDLACLDGLKKLERFQVGGIDGKFFITDAGMKHLAGLDQLWQLSIGGPGVTDASMEYLAGMPKLSYLMLNGKLSGAGLGRLGGLGNLGYVSITTVSPITSSAEQRFKKSHPASNLNITYNPDFYKPRARTAKANTGMNATTEANGHPKAGAKAPDFTVKTIDGKTFSLADQRGKVVIVHFWASWCKPCVAGTPELKKLQDRLMKKFGDKFVWVDLSLDDYERNVIEHVREYDIKAVEARIGQNSKIATDYAVRGVPDDFMIGPDGKILLTRESPQIDTESAIAKALGQM